MSKPLMSASFMWYKTFCFDVTFKREETQKVCSARVPESTQIWLPTTAGTGTEL